MYRLYNPNAKAGSHHYTLSSTERDNLVQAGWKSEGIGFYSTFDGTTGFPAPNGWGVDSGQW
ncbi:hypothetical protein KUA55_17320 [Enterococcus sp. ALS3]|uniref:DUF5648 domain-containing protein n=1 Tax=Enterococcus alishanensis TaxID=1303817 RepID=A0ABS6THN0_9ENTE|nr:hypothetical protein [Enterococcus alishanensis]